MREGAANSTGVPEEVGGVDSLDKGVSHLCEVPLFTILN